ncbi:MAG TPA: transcription antitermination factor NusB [Thermoleophilaceae bacterium]|nr:transcription antitermination factor NusB [Thermoleophilaceae bacterium]
MRRSDQRRAAVIALYQHDVTSRPLGDLLPRDASDFTKELIEGTEREREAIDAVIERHAVGWTLDRIAPLERSILRVALHEMRSREDVPAEVAIDEAIEAAKELCSADAPKFVNGILGAAQRERVGAG